MKESVTYQEILEEGKMEGKMEGKIEGKMEGKEEEKREIAIKLLKQDLSIEFVAMITGLSLETVEELKLNLS